MEDLKENSEINLAYNPNLATQAENDYVERYALSPDDTYVSRFSSVYPAPKPYTPKQEQQTRNAASMAETLKSLAEIYGQSKGAQLRQRNPEESTKAENKILYDKNKYDTDLREYSRAMVGAMGQDSEQLRSLRANASKYGEAIAQRDYLAKKAALDRDNKLKDDKTRMDFQADENEKNRNATKTNASIRANKPSSSGAGSTVQITDANGNISQLPYRDWNTKSQSIYTAMKANGLAPLITEKANPLDPRKPIITEDKNPSNIRAYVERNINSKHMTPELWKEIYALSGKKPYTPTPPAAKKNKYDF